MISVQEAAQIILSENREYGAEEIPFELAAGRVLAKDIVADRELPPCNRATMDGIAICFEAFSAGCRSFKLVGTQAAGDAPKGINDARECIEIMTGAALHASVDTVIRYEDVTIMDNVATIAEIEVRKGQNIHYIGKDKQKGDVVARAGQWVDAAIISIAATVGQSTLVVKKLPRVVIISTGDELVGVDATPLPWQVRRSNSYAMKSVLGQFHCNADLLHLPDEPATIEQQIADCLNKYDVLLLSGGVSMGKFDYLPVVLEQLGVQKRFHKVRQRPGKPFWFGLVNSGPLVFAFPGNPVSAFLCLHRYFIPWLKKVLGVYAENKMVAILDEDVSFPAPLQYFMQVKLGFNQQGQLTAKPIQGNGSGDLANLIEANAFMELPFEQENFEKGNVFPVWLYK